MVVKNITSGSGKRRGFIHANGDIAEVRRIRSLKRCTYAVCGDDALVPDMELELEAKVCLIRL